MSLSTRNPLRLVGGNLNSGFAGTGEVMWTRGGQQTATIYSGIIAGAGLTAAPGAVNVGSDTLFFSGAGRLNTIIPLVQASGAAVVFYDAVAPVSGGPIYASGHKQLGVLPANTLQGGAGYGVFGAGPLNIPVDVPFFSGLCAGIRSGCAAFTISFTPETNPTNPS